jgi:hypothetical protein
MQYSLILTFSPAQLARSVSPSWTLATVQAALGVSRAVANDHSHGNGSKMKAASQKYGRRRRD